MRFRSSLFAIVVALAIAAPAPASARPIHVENHTAAWVHFSVNFPSAPKPQPQSQPSRCLAPGEQWEVSNPADSIAQVYVIALSGEKCYAPRLWEHSVHTGGKGSIVTVGHSAATLAANSSGTVRVENKGAAWAMISVLLLPPPTPVPTPAQTSWCVEPGASITTPDLPDNGSGYVIVLANKNCYAPRQFEHQANGHHIIVSGKPESYSVEAKP